MFCPKCGKENNDDAKYCSGCGGALRADAFAPSDNMESTVYGPPLFPGGYKPSDNMTAPVYGPPEMMDAGRKTSGKTKKPHPRARWYGRFWRNTFRYGGTAGRQEYYVPVLVTILVMAAELPLLLLAIATDYMAFDVLVFAFALYLTASLFPMISLTVRRLRSVGRSGMWAGLILAVGIGTVILMWMCGTADFSAEQNYPDEVYGPPVEDDVLTDEDLPEEDYSASENMEECVYGPPEWFEDEADQ